MHDKTATMSPKKLHVIQEKLIQRMYTKYKVQEYQMSVKYHMPVRPLSHWGAGGGKALSRRFAGIFSVKGV